MLQIRLQKYIADCGVCSRRHAETLITEARITVNGQIISRLGTKVDPQKDVVKLDSKRLFLPKQNQLLVYALYKPKRCVTTNFDPQGRETITKFIPTNAPRIYPVGRLDYDTEGLLLLTNDGDLAQKIMHPRYEIWKTYLVKINGFLKDDDMNLIRKGFKLRGKMTAPAKIKSLHKINNKSWIEISLKEGRNHQIKNLILHFGMLASKIKRIQIANISIGQMQVGECRKLTLKELNDLKDILNLATKEKESLITK